MRLIENYLAQAGQFLPSDVRGDVVLELRSTLEESVARRAEREAREPSDEDQRFVLAEMGHPLAVASQYLPQQHLIGPQLFPIYLHALRIVASIVLAVHIVLALALAQEFNVIGLLLDLVTSVFWAIAWVTVIFAALEYSGERFDLFSRWSPDSLQSGVATPVSYSDQVTNVVSEGLLLLWWNGLIALPTLAGVQPTDVWANLHWPVNGIVGALFASHIWVMVRGYWTRNHLRLEVLLTVGALLLIGWLVATDLIILTEANRLTDVPIEFVVKFALMNVAAFVFWDLWKGVRSLRTR